MILKIYTVRDIKGEIYLPPFTMRARGEALRGFQEVCNDPNHQFYKFPSDYTLYEIGSFDDNTGDIIYSGAVDLGKASDFKNKSSGSAEILSNGQPVVLAKGE